MPPPRSGQPKPLPACMRCVEFGMGSVMGMRRTEHDVRRLGRQCSVSRKVRWLVNADQAIRVTAFGGLQMAIGALGPVGCGGAQ